MKTKLEEIADEIISYADGAFEIPWGEAFVLLTPEEKNDVEQMVYEAIANCDCCGWNFNLESLDEHDSGLLCWRCYEDAVAEDEESED